MIPCKAWRILGLVLFLIVWPISTAAMEPVTIMPGAAIGHQFQYWEDTSTCATLDEIRALPDAAWQVQANGRATLGITDSAYWLRVPVVNHTPDSLSLIAELAYSQLDDVTFHVIAEGELVRTFQTGDRRPFYPRDVDHPNSLLRFQLAPQEAKTLYIRVVTEGTMVLPFSLWRENQFYESAGAEQKLQFFYFGSLTVIILINLAVFLTLREKLYLYYCLAIFGYLVFFASIRGFSLQHIYPAFPAVHAQVLMLSIPFLAMFSILFCMEFLRVRSHSPRLRAALIGMLIFEVLYFLAVPFLDYKTGILLAAVSAFVFFSLLMIAGPVSWAAGVRAGIFFTVAWSPLTVGVMATAGRALGVFPENFFTNYAMQIGSGLEAFILTLALADRLYREREQKIQAQADILRQEKARRDAQDRLTYAMTHDPATGLPNRNRFEWMVDEQLKLNPGGSYMVGVARVTGLEEINRTLGLERSERLLKRLAEQMTMLAGQLPMVHATQDSLGRTERVYQISGDSFGLLVDARKAGDDFGALDSALKQLAQPIALDHLAIDPHLKYGAASFPDHGKKASVLIRNAHVAMEMTPRGSFETGFYSGKYDIYDESRLTLISHLREAIQNRQTELYYQPKIRLSTGEVVGVEALMRWFHPERGWVPPDEFIPLAEKTGVIKHLTRWVVDQALADLKSLQSVSPGLTMSVNISARDLLSPGLDELFATALETYGLQAGDVIVELTETAAMDDPDKGLQALERLASSGLKVSIDDFGAGYSSLSYLKRLPADEIKLDRSLLQDICSSDSSRTIAETAITMGRSLGFLVVAEGVEDEASARLLATMGADMLQGFWLCRPAPLESIKDWLLTSSSVV
ncbi:MULTISPECIES: EAL domain-containing protein [Marinobacter]|uniref:Diguanylate cyclase/phosphodiesterase (GGDEF & EAL domain with PAS/PAC sensor(S)) n=1 Tax=Marinobacter excellens LAMA 842 TaxID=1306954 RepID=A0A137SC88_9GAMM|nr:MULTISPECIES: EAL domain-containing protein [Marinobacter]KXO10056.1 diguanylate cyclase/phosphodiesterase (GGDEF & EAL domain with PAS/PAC sensor(s)) [Marinobacter excellens LAMA 842]